MLESDPLLAGKMKQTDISNSNYVILNIQTTHKQLQFIIIIHLVDLITNDYYCYFELYDDS